MARSPVASGPGKVAPGSRAASQSRCGPAPITTGRTPGSAGQPGQPAYAVPLAQAADVADRHAGARRVSGRATTGRAARGRAAAGVKAARVDARAPTGDGSMPSSASRSSIQREVTTTLVGAVADVAAPVVGGDVEQRRLLGDQRAARRAAPACLQGAGARRVRGRARRARGPARGASSAARTWRPGRSCGADPRHRAAAVRRQARARARRGRTSWPVSRSRSASALTVVSARCAPGATARTGKKVSVTSAIRMAPRWRRATGDRRGAAT